MGRRITTDTFGEGPARGGASFDIADRPGADYFERGAMHCVQNRFENVDMAVLIGWGMAPPKWIAEEHRAEYLRGYRSVMVPLLHG